MSREIMQQALDALTLECCDNNGNPVDLIQPAIAALEQELAKPEPKLTDAGADTNITRGLEPKGSGMVTLNQVGMRVDLKDAPPRKPWVNLTDEEVNLIYAEPQTHVGQYARAIEAKLKEKNDVI
jgi:hypothetical protein